MSEIINSVTTPLALAALVVLAFAGYGEFAKTRAGKPLSQRAFWIILLFGVIGSLTYVAREFWFSDALFQGELRTEDGKPVKHATIDLARVGRSATNENGSFEISIPYSRQAEEYTLYTFFNGLPGKEMKIQGPRPEFAYLKFASDASLEKYVRFGDVVRVGQNIGDPLVTVNMKIRNDISGRIKIELSQLRLVLPDGSVQLLFPLTTYRNGMSRSPEVIIVDEDNRSTEYSIVGSPDASRVGQLGQELAKTVSATWLGDCVNIGANSQLLTSLQAFFDSVFIWKAGNYKLEAKFRVEDFDESVNFTFDITENESKKLQAMRQKLDRCRGIDFDLSRIGLYSYSDADANNIIVKALEGM